MNSVAADKCMEAFKTICDATDSSDLVSSEDWNYWVFESGYKAAMQERSKTAKLNVTQKPADYVSQMLANGFALLG